MEKTVVIGKDTISNSKLAKKIDNICEYVNRVRKEGEKSNVYEICVDNDCSYQLTITSVKGSNVRVVAKAFEEIQNKIKLLSEKYGPKFYAMRYCPDIEKVLTLTDKPKGEPIKEWLFDNPNNYSRLLVAIVDVHQQITYHGDLWLSNIYYDEESDTITFINPRIKINYRAGDDYMMLLLSVITSILKAKKKNPDKLSSKGMMRRIHVFILVYNSFRSAIKSHHILPTQCDHHINLYVQEIVKILSGKSKHEFTHIFKFLSAIHTQIVKYLDNKCKPSRTPNEYFILDEEDNTLYISNKTPKSNYLGWLLTKDNKQGVEWLVEVKSYIRDYKAYEWNPLLETKENDPNTFRNDCFAFSERIKLRDLSYDGEDFIVQIKGITPQEVKKKIVKGYEPEYEWSKGGGVYFGLDDMANFAIAKVIESKQSKVPSFGRRLPIGEVPNPQLGEIVIGLREPEDYFNEDNHCPYHAATVIGRDEGYYVTLEANAALSKRKAPAIRIYKDDNVENIDFDSTETFLETWDPSYQYRAIGF